MGHDFIKNKHDPCAYKKVSGSTVVYLVLYANNILLFGNDVKMLGDIKGEASYILGIKIYKDRSQRMLGLTRSSYIEKSEEIHDGKLKTGIPSNET
ncbi:UNVERIFIED_CONTAM: hypothetical protein Scaly_2924100 [Sesamum calycinum]|uniref:Reverse transcriptase Ty1/copia-type domain-containing protein n=1 Tax=Sesamum calycinum TaxID=2727403 RepID=A0AAW2KY14_9LAMI